MRKPSPTVTLITIALLLAVGMLAGWHFLFREQARLGREIGHGAAAAVCGSEVWELVSLYPYPASKRREPTRDDEDFKLSAKPLLHGFYELGRAKLSVEEIKALRSAFIESVLNPPSHGPADCFWPRHGLVINDRGEVFEMLICFQCSSGVVESGKGKSFVVNKQQATEFNRAVDAHRLQREGRKESE